MTSAGPSSGPSFNSELYNTAKSTRRNIRVSKAGLKIMKEYFDTTSKNPDRKECAEILQQIRMLGPDDAQYKFESVLDWFKRNRAAAKKKNEGTALTLSAQSATQGPLHNRQSSLYFIFFVSSSFAHGKRMNIALYPSLSSFVIEQLTTLYNVMTADQENADERTRLYEVWSMSHTFLQQGALPQDIRNWTAERERSLLCVDTGTTGMCDSTSMASPSSATSRQRDLGDYPQGQDYAYGLPTPSDTASSDQPLVSPSLAYPTPSSRSASLAPSSEPALLPVIPSLLPPVSASMPTSTVNSYEPQPESYTPLGTLILRAIKGAMDEEALNPKPDLGNPQNYPEFMELWTPWEKKMKAILDMLHPNTV
ncbi:hypothetical protein B0H10DRAFT_2036643 [Mycena sp. CBHHK59/15]|nr:hypothetical protein B0H10DRAFT_2036643 [Mycena sp. CBHHK59/15]